MGALAVTLCLAGGVAGAVDLPQPETATPSYVVVAAPDVEGQMVPRGVLAEIFLGKVERWGSGKLIRPVDQSLRSGVREAFSQQVLGMGSDQLYAYWREAITQNRRPPRVLDTDAKVLEHVASTPGAIGYVSAEAPVASFEVKVIEVADDSNGP